MCFFKFTANRKWFTDHLSLRSLLKRPMEANRKALDLKSYYTLGLAYASMIGVAIISFLAEKLRYVKANRVTNRTVRLIIV